MDASFTRGKIYNRERASQIKDYSGLRWGNITPTDIDGIIEWKDKCFIVFEAKRQGNDLPYGQKLALMRLIDNLSKPAILFVANHNAELGTDIDMANAIVEKYYWQGEWKQVKQHMLLREAIDGFIKSNGNN